jgi:hypothetical protein
MKITEYATVVEDSPYELERSVQDMIKSGFQPFGSLAVAVTQDEGVSLGGTIFIQPMVIYGE